MSSSLYTPGPSVEPLLAPPARVRSEPGGLLVVCGRLLGVLLAGYLLFDKAFAYIHLPGTPLYVAEMVLVVGGLGILAATGYLRVVVRDEPILTLLAAFFLWGFVRFLPGLRTYGILAVRDFALVYYCLFAFFTAAALAKSPDILSRWIAQLVRFVPWLLIWLPFATVAGSLASVAAPNVPFTSVSVITHAPGSSAIAALLALGALWLFPDKRSVRSRVAWSVLALVVVVLSATQNRGGLLSVVAGAIVGLAFFRDRLRLRLITRTFACFALGLVLVALLSVNVSIAGWQQRSFSASQLFTNVASIAGAQGNSDLNATVTGREHLWSLVYGQQAANGTLIYGSGFGVNLAEQVGVYDSSPSAPLRSPHNSHLDVLARLGFIGFSLWIVLWLGWFWRLVVGCRRLAERRLYLRRQVAVLCLMVNTAILVTSYFDPALEGAQVAVLLWTVFGVGVVVTSFRAWFGDRDLQWAAPASPSRSALSR